jgi:hypothetical protein
LNAAASGVSGIADDGALRIKELYFRGLTMPATFEQLVLRLQKLALKRVGLQIQRRALEGVAFSRDLHPALGLQGVLRLVVFNAVRPHGQALFAQQHIAFNDQVQIGPSKQALTRYKQGRLLALNLGDFFF